MLDDWVVGEVTEVQGYDKLRVQYMVLDQVIEQVVSRYSVQIRPFPYEIEQELNTFR